MYTSQRVERFSRLCMDLSRFAMTPKSWQVLDPEKPMAVLTMLECLVEFPVGCQERHVQCESQGQVQAA
jgi:hypothetical protein